MNFTRTVAAEAGPYGARERGLSGLHRYRVGRGVLRGTGRPREGESANGGQYTLKRLGPPEEIADAIAYLASVEASYVIGHGLVLDGATRSRSSRSEHHLEAWDRTHGHPLLEHPPRMYTEIDPFRPVMRNW